MNSPSSVLSNGAAKITNKILIDHTKQPNSSLIHSPSSTTVKNEPMNNDSPSYHPNLLQSSLLSSPRSAFSRTSKTSMHSPDHRSTSVNHTPKSTPMHPTILSGDVTPSTTLNESRDNDLTATTDITDDENLSDSSTNTNNEINCDDGPAPLTCDRECYNRSQGIVLLQTYDRSMSQNSCARTDIVLKRGSRSRCKPPPTNSTNSNEKSAQQEAPSVPTLPPPPPTSSSSSTAAAATAMMMMGLKQEERNLSVCFLFFEIIEIC